MGFNLVNDVGFGSGVVEAKAFFENKGVVKVEGEAGEPRAEIYDADESETGAKFTKAPRVDETVDPAEASKEPEGEKDAERGDGRDEAEFSLGFFVILRFEVFFVIPDPLEFLGEFFLEIFESEKAGDEVELPQEEQGKNKNDGKEVELWHVGKVVGVVLRDKMIFDLRCRFFI